MLKIGTIFRSGESWFVVMEMSVAWNFITKENEAWIRVKKNADGAIPVDLPVANLPKEEFEIAPSGPGDSNVPR